MIGNITKPDVIDCLPACQVQDNFNQMTYAPYPQEQNFFYQETFCSVASHIWQSTFPKVLLVARQCWKFVSSKSKCPENVTNIDHRTKFKSY